MLNKLSDGEIWKFRLTANPAVREVHKGDSEKEKIRACKIIDEQKAWLLNRARKHGFQLSNDSFEVVQNKWRIFYKEYRNKISLLSVTYEGILTITNADLFRETLINGIGRGKAYGMGLLTIVRV